MTVAVSALPDTVVDEFSPARMPWNAPHDLRFPEELPPARVTLAALKANSSVMRRRGLREC
jgi:hypothetical protein